MNPRSEKTRTKARAIMSGDIARPRLTQTKSAVLPTTIGFLTNAVQACLLFKGPCFPSSWPYNHL